MTDSPRIPDPTILFLDEHVVVVDKPAGVLSVPGRGKGPDLPDLLRRTKLVPPESDLRSVHRLDREASGVIVFARTLDAERHLTAQFEARNVEKVYLALVVGRVERDGEVDMPIATDADGTRARVDRVEGKPARTAYHVAQALGTHTLLECRPASGRLHQIRVHMAAIGHALAVDPLYGRGKGLFLSDVKRDYRPSRHAERPLIGRLTLHALRLTIRHPASDTPLTIEAPLPKDFRATLRQLEKLQS